MLKDFLKQKRCSEQEFAQIESFCCGKSHGGLKTGVNI